jgi:hypothetical protein
MALTQMQLIQSLGEAMSWFERELNWGVPPTELRHLCGRIGELYTALIVNGQMASEVNQRGYDVVSDTGERISVKTTATMGSSSHVAFNANSMQFVDRVMVLRMNTEEMQIETLLNASVAELMPLLKKSTDGKLILSLSRLTQKPVRKSVAIVDEVEYAGAILKELESGTIEITVNGKDVIPVKPLLRELAFKLNIPLLNSRGNALNTRQLGTLVIRSVRGLTP